MQIQQQNHHSHTVIALRGNLSVDAVDQLRKAASDRLSVEQPRLILDCEALEYIDSRGLEALIWLQNQCGELLGQLRLARCPAHIRKVLEVTHLWSRFDCHPSVDDAVASLAA